MRYVILTNSLFRNKQKKYIQFISFDKSKKKYIQFFLLKYNILSSKLKMLWITGHLKTQNA